MNPAFSEYSHADVRRLIDEYPLAWVICPGAPAASAALLPMLGQFGTDGALTGLVGHMSRQNALYSLLSGRPRGQFMFTGPHGYISPEVAGRKNWGPTWNYAAARIEADVTFDEQFTPKAVEMLVDACEAGRDEPWSPGELGGRYSGMLNAIIGFTAKVVSVDATFKLAQDEDLEVLGSLLSNHPDARLRDWMADHNRKRL